MKTKKDREWLIQHLRGLSLKWRGRSECFKASKRENRVVGHYKNGKPKTHVHYQCNGCKEMFRPQSLEVDHIDEVGSFKDWDTYIERLFCEADNLQLLCVKCHKKKTREFVGKNRLVREEEIWL
jgi:hypothetical protein